ncbi:MAG: DNA ligase [Lachnospira sp.]|nr:DNA ligase [Lachnospira sp.]
MTHLSSIKELASDIVKLSKTLSTLAVEIESAHMQEPVEENAATTEKKAQKAVEAQKGPKTQTDSPEEEKNPSGTGSSNKEEKPTVTIEQVRAVLAEKSQAGLTSKVKTLLESFGANKLSAVDPAEYEKLLAAAQGLK